MRINSRKLQGILLLAGALALPLGASAAIYKWTDSNGHVHYSQSPPPGGRPAEQIKPPPEPTDTSSALKNLKAQEQQFDQQHKQRLKQRKEKASAEKKAAALKARCDDAHNRLERLQTTIRVYKTDAQGNRVRLPESERQANIDKARKDIAKYCR